MRTVNIHDPKTHQSDSLARVENGETITIARAGKPVADLVPHVRADIALADSDADHFDEPDSDLKALFGFE